MDPTIEITGKVIGFFGTIVGFTGFIIILKIILGDYLKVGFTRAAIWMFEAGDDRAKELYWRYLVNKREVLEEIYQQLHTRFGEGAGDQPQ